MADTKEIERRIKISETLKRKYATGERESAFFSHTKESKQKISKNNARYWAGKKRPEMIEILSKTHKGRKCSLETRMKMSKSHQERLKNYKYKTTCEICGVRLTKGGAKRCLKHVGELRSGIKNGMWNGGTSIEPYAIGWRKIRDNIRNRDNNICQVCGVYGGLKNLDVHHIDYDKKNCNSDNLITLCKSCHAKTNINRLTWINRLGVCYG